MNNAYTDHRRGIFNGCLASSVLLFLLHLYYYCRAIVLHWGLMPDPALKVMVKIEATGFFRHIGVSKFLALVFLALSLLGPSGRKNKKFNAAITASLVMTGLVIFFISALVYSEWRTWDMSLEKTIRGEIWYAVASVVGYILLLAAGKRLSQRLPSSFGNKDPFGRDKAGFPQERRRRESTFSLHFRARYEYRGKEKKSWINIINPRRGVLILGSPGSGKSWFIIEPCIRQLSEKGMAMFIYDYKYDVLTRLAYNHFQQNKHLYPKGAAFYTINFTDLSRSHRCNLLDPSGLQWISDAFGVSRTLLYSLNKTWIHKQGEFFVESPINFLAALIWFLRKYETGRYCTLPHVIELAQVEYEKLFSILSLEPEIRGLVKPFIEAYKDDVMDMLDSQVSSARIPLARLASPDLYYILTGNDCSLDINDPAAPKILCLAGDPPRQEALAPVLSLYIDQLNKQVNRAGRYPCALICDEFATVRAYSILATMATARSNDIIPILAIQDINQLRTHYSRDEADMILNIAGNVICGQVGGETAQRISERFPRILQDHDSISSNSNDTSVSHSSQWTEAITPATIAQLSSGEFVGVIADDPGQTVEYKAFHARLVQEHWEPPANKPLPLVRDISRTMILEVYHQVKQDVESMVRAEIARMLADEDLRLLMVAR